MGKLDLFNQYIHKKRNIGSSRKLPYKFSIKIYYSFFRY